MIPEIFSSGDIDLKHIFGNRATSDGKMEDAELITRIKSILGPFVLRCLKSDVMHRLVEKTQKVI
jgi:SWI/SNF-related matrix-associated actin-dependent regulator 1 of chromatin subfamily A